MRILPQAAHSARIAEVRYADRAIGTIKAAMTSGHVLR